MINKNDELSSSKRRSTSSILFKNKLEEENWILEFYNSKYWKPPFRNSCEEIFLSPPVSISPPIQKLESQILVQKIDKINREIQNLLDYLNPDYGLTKFQNTFDAQSKFVELFLEWRSFDSQNEKVLISWKNKAHEMLMELAKELGLG